MLRRRHSTVQFQRQKLLPIVYRKVQLIRYMTTFLARVSGWQRKLKVCLRHANRWRNLTRRCLPLVASWTPRTKMGIAFQKRKTWSLLYSLLTTRSDLFTNSANPVLERQETCDINEMRCMLSSSSSFILKMSFSSTLNWGYMHGTPYI